MGEPLSSRIVSNIVNGNHGIARGQLGRAKKLQVLDVIIELVQAGWTWPQAVDEVRRKLLIEQGGSR